MKKAYTILYQTIQAAGDLRKYKLTITEYHAACDLLKALYTTKKPQITFFSAVAEFFQNCNFCIKMDAANINYIISAREAQ